MKDPLLRLKELLLLHGKIEFRIMPLYKDKTFEFSAKAYNCFNETISTSTSNISLIDALLLCQNQLKPRKRSDNQIHISADNLRENNLTFQKMDYMIDAIRKMCPNILLHNQKFVISLSNSDIKDICNPNDKYLLTFQGKTYDEVLNKNIASCSIDYPIEELLTQGCSHLENQTNMNFGTKERNNVIKLYRDDYAKQMLKR